MRVLVSGLLDVATSMTKGMVLAYISCPWTHLPELIHSISFAEETEMNIWLSIDICAARLNYSILMSSKKSETTIFFWRRCEMYIR